MAGAYILVSGGSEDHQISLSPGLPDEIHHTYYRYALLRIANINLARRVVKTLQREHGMSPDVCEDWRLFEVVPEKDLSDEDFVLARDLRNSKLTAKRPDWLGQCVELAKELQKHAQKHPDRDFDSLLESLGIPHDRITGKTESGSVILWGGQNQPIVNEKRKAKLGTTTYNLILGLVKAGKRGMDKNDIEEITPAARKTLRGLREDRDWRKVIKMPGKAGRKYRVI